MSSLSLYVTAPPFMHVGRLDGEPPPLGAVLLVDLAERPANAPDVWPVLELAPWCPVCVLLRDLADRRRLPRSHRVCAVSVLEGGGGASAILSAVRLRPRPAPMELAEWLTHRGRAPAMRAPLVTLIGRAVANRGFPLSGGSTLDTPFPALGAWTARAWQDVARLADLAADREAMGRLLVRKTSASVHALSAIDELLGVSEDEFRERAGWEWVLETALRRSRGAAAKSGDRVFASPQATAATMADAAAPYRTSVDGGRVPAAYFTNVPRQPTIATR